MDVKYICYFSNQKKMSSTIYEDLEWGALGWWPQVCNPITNLCYSFSQSCEDDLNNNFDIFKSWIFFALIF